MTAWNFPAGSFVFIDKGGIPMDSGAFLSILVLVILSLMIFSNYGG